ncbi:MAG: hypothetical protein ACOYXU_01460 [Nitrospirota bacterium]
MTTSEGKIYKPFPGIVEWLVYLPWSLPCLLGINLIALYITGYTFSKLTWFLALATLLLSLYQVILVGAIVSFTTLMLDQRGVTYQGIDFRQSPKYFPPIALSRKTIKATWEEIIGIEWAGKPNGLIVIKTQQEQIHFGVLFHPKTNAEIMGTILEKAPRLRRASGGCG